MTAAPVIAAQPKGEAWHHLQSEEALRLLDVEATTGLSSAQIETRREKFGPNRVTARRGTPTWLKFLQQFNRRWVHAFV